MWIEGWAKGPLRGVRPGGRCRRSLDNRKRPAHFALAQHSTRIAVKRIVNEGNNVTQHSRADDNGIEGNLSELRPTIPCRP